MNTLTIRKANQILCVVTIVMVGLQWILTRGGFYNVTLLLLVSQLSVLIIPMVMCRRISIHPKEEFHIRKINLKTIVFAFFMVLCCYPVVALLNLISMLFVENAIVETSNAVFQQGLFLSLLLMAIFPAIGEEFLMRGVVYRAYRKKSPVLAWILSALLFGLLHMNLNQMPYAFFLGIIMVVMMEASDSLITSMCIHFFVNGISTITGYFSQLEVQSPAAEVLLQEKEMFLSMGLLAVCMIPLILLLIVATLRVNKRKFCMITEKETSEMEYAEQKILDPWLLLTLIVMVVLIAMDTFR